ncbi:MAG: CDP-alcohol phosphatidyltransferase family protein [Clostridia bacterium]|nr:CDP-alcohol phosphatidyltransferase family protein [Clostridia bacterium]
MIRILPNILTFMRLLMAFAFVPLFFYEQNHNPDGNLPLLLYTVASVTDIIDGYIARRYSAVSNFGKIFDPLADKLLQFLVSVSIACVEPMFAIIPIFLFVREIMMMIGAILLYKKNVVLSSNLYGKLASVVYFLLFFTMLGFRKYIPTGVKIAFIVIFLSVSLVAFIRYIQIYSATSKAAK